MRAVAQRGDGSHHAWMLRAAAIVVALAGSALAQEQVAPARSPRSPEVRRAVADARLASRPQVLVQPEAGGREAAGQDGPAREPGTVPCPVDWCQPAVDVPGMERAHARVSRSELVAMALDGAGLAPVADLLWVVAGTGLELDWRPAQLETSNGTAGSGRGSVTLWLKLRMDALGRPSFPARERR